MDSPLSGKPKKEHGFEDWQVEEAVRTLRSVGKILGEPELLKLAEKKLKDEDRGIKSIADLKKAYANLVEDEMPKKAGVKAPASDKAAEEDNLPATSKFKSYKEVKKVNDATDDGDE